MSIDKLTNDTRLYTDVQALEQLRTQSKRDPNATKKQVAQQFESLLMQMLMKSMRDANKAITPDDDQSNNDMDFYQEMFDKQLSLNMSSHGLGIAKMIEQNMDAQSAARPDTASSHMRPFQISATLHKQTNGAAADDSDAIDVVDAAPAPIIEQKAATTHPFDSPKSFVKAIWSAAKKAANTIGVAPSVLIAQAALETDWGKKALHNNLFNIKADSHWKNATTAVASLENKNGVLVKEKANYRAYDSIEDSISDYANFVKSNQRYREALSESAHPAAYMNALQSAGYATDSQYAEKVMAIHESSHFKSLLIGLK